MEMDSKKVRFPINLVSKKVRFPKEGRIARKNRGYFDWGLFFD